jgi:hypothetical protein
MPPIAPTISIYPNDGATDVFTRDAIRVQCVDDQSDPTDGVDTLTLGVTLTVGSAAMPVIVNGVFATGVVGAISGDEMDPTNGIVARILPLGGKWIENETYTIDVYVQNNFGDARTATADIQMDSHTCFEDSLPPVTPLETYITTGPFPTKLEKLRSQLMQNVSNNGSAQSRARAILWFAHNTDLASVLKTWVDPELANVKVCDRRNPMAIYLRMAKFIPDIKNTVAELTFLAQQARDVLVTRARDYQNQLYNISALSNIVVLGAVGKEQGWL